MGQGMEATPAVGRYWLIDGPGITGMGSNSLQRMAEHADKGGAFLHEIAEDGSLVRPELMWPGEPQEVLTARNRAMVENRQAALKAAGRGE